MTAPTTTFPWWASVTEAASPALPSLPAPEGGPAFGAAAVRGMYPEIDALTDWAWRDYAIYAVMHGVVDPLYTHLLALVVFLPLVGAVVVALLPSPADDAVTPPTLGKGELWTVDPAVRRIQGVAMAFAMATVVAGVLLYLAFDTATDGFQFPVVSHWGTPEAGWTLTAWREAKASLRGPAEAADAVRAATVALEATGRLGGAPRGALATGPSPEAVAAAHELRLPGDPRWWDRAAAVRGAGGHAVMGVDGLSLPFLGLNVLLLPICLMAGWHAVAPRQQKLYAVLFLSLATLVGAVFTLLDLILFYVAFEAVLLPMVLVVGRFGSRARKVAAAYQFFLYTLAGSILLLLGVLALTALADSSSYLIVRQLQLTPAEQKVLFLLFFASFAVKVPMVPVHLWLPEAHAEAPTGGSVILAGVLLKMGTYGFLRFSLPLFPVASVYFQPAIVTASLVAVVYASATTLRQTDWKKVIAYSSVAHMAYGTLGIFAFTAQGVEGAMVAMVSHGLVSPGLFLVVGMAYERTKTRVLEYYGGLATAMPVATAFFFLMTLGTMAVPGTSGFPGEFLVLQGVYADHRAAAVVAVLGTFLGTAYSLWLYNRVAYGHLKATLTHAMDLSSREFTMLGTLAVGVIWLGVYPEPLLAVIHASAYGLVEEFHHRTALAAAHALDDGSGGYGGYGGYVPRVAEAMAHVLGHGPGPTPGPGAAAGDPAPSSLNEVVAAAQGAGADPVEALHAAMAAELTAAKVALVTGGREPLAPGYAYAVVGRAVDAQGGLREVTMAFPTDEAARAAADAHREAWEARAARVAEAQAEFLRQPVDPTRWREWIPKSLTELLVNDLRAEQAQAGSHPGPAADVHPASRERAAYAALSLEARDTPASAAAAPTGTLGSGTSWASGLWTFGAGRAA